MPRRPVTPAEVALRGGVAGLLGHYGTGRLLDFAAKVPWWLSLALGCLVLVIFPYWAFPFAILFVAAYARERLVSVSRNNGEETEYTRQEFERSYRASHVDFLTDPEPGSFLDPDIEGNRPRFGRKSASDT